MRPARVPASRSRDTPSTAVTPPALRSVVGRRSTAMSSWSRGIVPPPGLANPRVVLGPAVAEGPVGGVDQRLPGRPQPHGRRHLVHHVAERHVATGVGEPDGPAVADVPERLLAQ